MIFQWRMAKGQPKTYRTVKLVWDCRRQVSSGYYINCIRFNGHHLPPQGIMAWNHCLHYFVSMVRGINRPPAKSPIKGHQYVALFFPLNKFWANKWVAGDWKRHDAHVVFMADGNFNNLRPASGNIQRCYIVSCLIHWFVFMYIISRLLLLMETKYNW